MAYSRGHGGWTDDGEREFCQIGPGRETDDVLGGEGRKQ